MARANQPRPLPQAPQPRVSDTNTQRAFDLLFVPLREVIRFLQPFVQQEKWQALPYLSGWADIPSTGSTYTRGQYRKDPLGRVWLRGVVTRVSGATLTIATLPEGYRPSRGCIFIASSNSVDCRIDVSSDGVINYVSGGLPGNYISLDGISFDTVNE